MDLNFPQQQKRQIHFYMTTGATLFTAVALYEALKFQVRIVQNQHTRELVSSGKVTHISDLSTTPRGKQVMISGTVDTVDKNIVRIETDKKTESLALRLLYKESIYSNESYDLEKKDYNINLNEVLKGSSLVFNPKITLNQGFSSVRIKNIDKIDFSPALDILKWENKRRDLTVFENLTAFFLAVLRGVAMIGVKDRDVTFLRGIQIGTREVETGIKIGASLTALGTLGVTTEGVLFIQPSAIFKERFTFLHELTEKLEDLTSKRNLWLGTFIVGAIYVGRRAYKYFRNRDLPWRKKSYWSETAQSDQLYAD